MHSFSASIDIFRSASAITDYCTRFENIEAALPAKVGIRALPDLGLSWKVDALFGVELEGEVEHQNLASGRVLIWSSVKESAPKFEITLEIFEAGTRDECEVHLSFNWEPVCGDLCGKALLLSGLDPKVVIPSVLRQMKRDLESDRQTGLRALVTEIFTADVWSLRGQTV